MWSHYANSHRGVCFEIIFPEVNQDNYKEKDIVPISVTYCDDLYVERQNWTMESEHLPLYLATYKSNIWKYEEEIRLVLHSEVIDKEKFTVINTGKNADTVFNIESITKVIFGVKSSPEDIESIVKLFCEKGHLPVFYRIDLNPITLQFVEYELPHKKNILEHNKTTPNTR